ncbi:MAG: cysteine synthase A [Arcobacter sp.]|uniref:cysteine synthase A n=1 Tax=Arcobacter sp. TaxID=1872629 RepID=UPI003AFFED14
MKYANNVTELIGNTPLVKLNKASVNGTTVLGKCEFMNPTHSVKDRIGFNMVEEAIKAGKIVEGTTVIEPTSGNTGIALASVCAAKGIKLILTMPSSMSIERRKLLKALGAQIVLTEPEKGMKGAVQKAAELSEAMDNSIVLQQFANESNPDIHRKTTALEILRDTEDKVDILVIAIGTGGSITGISEVVKAKNPNVKVIAVEPTDSPILSGGNPGPHKIQGIGAGFVPAILNTEIYDEVLTVSNDDAMETARNLAKEEGLLVGISAGANVYASTQIAQKEENKGKTIVTILCDTGERYLSTPLYQLDDE